MKSYRFFKKGILEGRHYFAVLGVHAQSTAPELNARRRKLAKTAHPDLNSDPQAHDLMAKINVAHATLTDSRRRTAYMATLGGKLCATCKGDGNVRRQKGFKAVLRTVCPTCEGSGRA